MLAGIVAFICLLVVTVSSLPGPRRRFYRGFAKFRAWHRILFILILLGSGWHVLGTDFTLTAPWQMATAVLLLGLLPTTAYVGRRSGWRLPLSPAPAGVSSADRSTAWIGLSVLAVSASYGGLRLISCASC